MIGTSPKIGFIGQGFIGKNYADDFEARGYNVIRYSLEEPYSNNKDAIASCDITFVAVPAPTVPGESTRSDGHPSVTFDDSILRSVIALTKPDSIVVIKSTIPPGTTESLESQYSDRIILHSPEFLVETTAAKDAAHPGRNIIGIPEDTDAYKNAAQRVLAILPRAPFELVCDARTAEHIKYANNAFLFLKIVFANMFYDFAQKNGADWETIRSAIAVDPRIGPSHLGLHLENDPPELMRRRGAGRSCFIKDLAEFSELYTKALPDEVSTIEALRGFEYKNAELLRAADRYVSLLEGVYGPDAGKKHE